MLTTTSYFAKRRERKVKNFSDGESESREVKNFSSDRERENREVKNFSRDHLSQRERGEELPRRTSSRGGFFFFFDPFFLRRFEDSLNGSPYSKL